MDSLMDSLIRLTALTTLPFCFVTPTTGDWWLASMLFIRGAALGILLIPVMTVAYVDVSPLSVPHATILTRMSQQVGASVGTAVAGALCALWLPAKRR